MTRYERSDVCVVPAAGVVGEAMLALTLADAWIEKFGGDSLREMSANVASTLPVYGDSAAKADSGYLVVYTGHARVACEPASLAHCIAV